jgi:hypothetical protein
MGHYAKVLDGIVTNVIVAKADFFETFVDTSAGDWIKCSYNTRGGVHYEPNSNNPSSDQTKALRKNFAGVDWKYDGVGFYEPQPYPSWTLNSDTYLWDPPYSVPDLTEEQREAGHYYDWDEESHQADGASGWVFK